MFSLEKADALPIGTTGDGRDVLALGRCSQGLIALVREPSSPTGLRWEDCGWMSNEAAEAEIIIELLDPGAGFKLRFVRLLPHEGSS